MGKNEKSVVGGDRARGGDNFLPRGVVCLIVAPATPSYSAERGGLLLRLDFKFSCFWVANSRLRCLQCSSSSWQNIYGIV